MALGAGLGSRLKAIFRTANCQMSPTVARHARDGYKWIIKKIKNKPNIISAPNTE